MDQRSRFHPACRLPTRARPLAVANGASAIQPNFVARRVGRKKKTRFGARGEATSRRDLRRTVSAHEMEVASPCRVRAVRAPRQVGSPQGWMLGVRQARRRHGCPDLSAAALAQRQGFRTPPGSAWPHPRPTASQVAGRPAHIAAQNRLRRLPISGAGGQQQGREDHRRPHETHPPPAGRQGSSVNDDLKPIACGATRLPLTGQVRGRHNSRLKIMHKL